MHTRLSVQASEIMAHSGEEHSSLELIPADPISLNAWLTEHWDSIAPAGLACLVAYTACTFAAGIAASWR
jgi:hypothetical protein